MSPERSEGRMGQGADVLSRAVTFLILCACCHLFIYVFKSSGIVGFVDVK